MDMKDVKFVQINGRKYNIEGEANSLDEVKEAAAQLDPSVSNADAVIEEDTVVFKFRAGTKGVEIKTVQVDGRTYEVDSEMYDNPEDIRTALLESHPNIANADYIVSGDGVMSFTFRAGTKG